MHRRDAGCLQAIKLMKSQPDGGHIFLMEGAGADGSATPRFAAYGASKRGLAQLRKSLQVHAAPRLSMECLLLQPALNSPYEGFVAGRVEAPGYRKRGSAQLEPGHGDDGVADER